jgi:sulfur relay (sulfurtransferase) complex TusBCD TusD component (DsrE family)
MKTIATLVLALVAGTTLGIAYAQHRAGDAAATAGSGVPTETSAGQQFKLALVLTQADPETVFNAFRVAQYALEQGDEVRVFLLGQGVELDRIKDPKFDVQEKARAFQAAGGRILACGTCLQMHDSAGSALCPVSTMSDLYGLIRSSDRVLTF